jgi:hypothetical protein
MDLAQLEACAAGNWDISVAKASGCDRVVAVKEGWPLGAWRLRGAFVSDEAPKPGHHRTSLALGEQLPVLPLYREPPPLRQGVAVV